MRRPLTAILESKRIYYSLPRLLPLKWLLFASETFEGAPRRPALEHLFLLRFLDGHGHAEVLKLFLYFLCLGEKIDNLPAR